VFRNFFAKHAEDFEGAPAMHSGEHNLKYYDLFNVYLKLYESTLENYLNTLDIPIEDFYREVREAQEETEDPYVRTFIDCLVASTDYDSFYRVMAREGNRSLSMKKLGIKSPVKAEAKSEAKGQSGDKKANYDGDQDGDHHHHNAAEAKGSSSSSTAAALYK
jgi:hypothetical protein